MRPAWQIELGRRWTEPHRRHHTIDHLREVLDSLNALAADGFAFDHEVVRRAAWFHDAIYDVHRDDNEERSAELARQMIAGAIGERVAQLVLVTKAHHPDPEDHDAAALCDADLSILGSSQDRYRKYADDIRQEYEHVPEPTYRSTRAAVLIDLLRNPCLYTSTQGQDRWEATARANVGAEVARLTGACGA